MKILTVDNIHDSDLFSDDVKTIGVLILLMVDYEYLFLSKNFLNKINMIKPMVDKMVCLFSPTCNVYSNNITNKDVKKNIIQDPDYLKSKSEENFKILEENIDYISFNNFSYSRTEEIENIIKTLDIDTIKLKQSLFIESYPVSSIENVFRFLPEEKTIVFRDKNFMLNHWINEFQLKRQIRHEYNLNLFKSVGRIILPTFRDDSGLICSEGENDHSILSEEITNALINLKSYLRDYNVINKTLKEITLDLNKNIPLKIEDSKYFVFCANLENSLLNTYENKIIDFEKGYVVVRIYKEGSPIVNEVKFIGLDESKFFDLETVNDINEEITKDNLLNFAKWD